MSKRAAFNDAIKLNNQKIKRTPNKELPVLQNHKRKKVEELLESYGQNKYTH